MSQIIVPNTSEHLSGDRIYQNEDRTQKSPTVAARVTIGKIGFGSAVLSSVCGAAYGIAVIAVFVSSLNIQPTVASQGWTGIDDFLLTFQPVAMLPLFPSLLLAPAFTALMVSIHAYAAEDKKIWGSLGLALVEGCGGAAPIQDERTRGQRMGWMHRGAHPVSAVIAYHLARGEVWDRAVDAYSAAGREAAAVYAAESALRSYGQAIAILEEHRRVLTSVSGEETERLLDALASARCIQVFGMGRMKCAVRAFVMRLMHLGLNAHVVYDTTCPNIGSGDLLIVNAAHIDPVSSDADYQALLDAAPQFETDCAALDALAAVDADTVRPIFLKTTAIGSLMRRKIQPIVTPLLDAIAVLRRQP